MRRVLCPQSSFSALGWLHVQNKVNSRSQEVRSIGLRDKRASTDFRAPSGNSYPFSRKSLSGIPVDAEQNAVLCHASGIYAGCPAILLRIAYIQRTFEIAPRRAIVLRYRKDNTVASLVYLYCCLGAFHEKAIPSPLRLPL